MVALLLMGLILVFVLAQLWECVRLRRRLAELKAIMEGLDQKQLFAECAPKPEGLWERELFALMHQSGQAMVGAVSEAQAAQREYREYVEQWVHEIKTPITAARLTSRTVGPDTRAGWSGNWPRSTPTWSGPCSMPGRRVRKRTW